MDKYSNEMKCNANSQNQKYSLSNAPAVVYILHDVMLCNARARAQLFNSSHLLQLVTVIAQSRFQWLGLLCLSKWYAIAFTLLAPLVTNVLVRKVRRPPQTLPEPNPCGRENTSEQRTLTSLSGRPLQMNSVSDNFINAFIKHLLKWQTHAHFWRPFDVIRRWMFRFVLCFIRRTELIDHEQLAQSILIAIWNVVDLSMRGS